MGEKGAGAALDRANRGTFSTGPLGFSLLIYKQIFKQYFYSKKIKNH